MIQNLMMACTMAKMRMKMRMSEEKGEVNIVAIVVLIGIAVLLALVFKDQIETLLDSLFGTITENATSAVGGASAAE